MNQSNTPATEPEAWKKCSSCKKGIPFSALYYLCSVSTCRQKRTGLRFCSVGCWDAHLGYANHRSSYAEEATAPSRQEYLQSEGANERPSLREPIRKIVEPRPPTTTVGGSPVVGAAVNPSTLPKTDTLVVVSKIKQLIREQSDFNTSECCIEALTRKVVKECLGGIEKARAMGRKTVMGRDIN